MKSNKALCKKEEVGGWRASFKSNSSSWPFPFAHFWTCPVLLCLSFSHPLQNKHPNNPQEDVAWMCVCMSSRLLIECVTHKRRLMFRGYQSSRSGTRRRALLLHSLSILITWGWAGGKFHSGNTSKNIFWYPVNCYPQEIVIISVGVNTSNEQDIEISLTS